MTRAALYCRISDDRAGGGLGVERQEKDCRALAERLGWQVGEVYVDNDLSAYNRRKPRPGYLRMLADLRAGTHNGLIAWHNDRLHRSARELEDFIDLVKAAGVAVQTVKAGEYDLTTPNGRMQARIAGAVAQQESEHKADRNRAKALELADAGKLGNGGPRPFGYKADRVTIEPGEALLLRQAYSDVLAGKGLRTICREWHEAGVTTTLGNPWSGQALRFTLLRARNMGWREHHGRLAAPAVWKPIVDRETWEQVKSKLTASTRPNAGQPQYLRRYLLSGLLRCGRCGSRLGASRMSAEVQRFGCRKEAGNGACGGILIRYDATEAVVVDLVLDRLEQGVDLTPDAPPDPTDLLRAQIADAEAKLDRLAAAYLDDGDALEMRRAGQALRERIAGWRRDIGQAAIAQRIADPVKVRQEWDGYDLHQRREVLDLLIERITVGPAKRGLNRFDPERLTVTWR